MAHPGRTMLRSVPSLARVGPWRKLQDKQGRTFYYNKDTQKKQWQKPAEVADAERKAAQSAPTAPPRRAEQSAPRFLPAGASARAALGPVRPAPGPVPVSRIVGRRSSGASSSSSSGPSGPGAGPRPASGAAQTTKAGGGRPSTAKAGSQLASASSAPITKLGQWRLVPAKKEGGKPFWYNKTTKKTQWSKPAEVVQAEKAQQGQTAAEGAGRASASNAGAGHTAAAAAVAIEPITKLGQWRLIPAKKEGGKPFWYNKTTKAKQWEKPAEVALEEQARQAQAQQAGQPATSAAGTMPKAVGGASEGSGAASQAAGSTAVEPITKLGQWRLIPAKKEGGKPFWYNKTTKAKQWEKPAEVALEEQTRQAQAAAGSSRAGTPGTGTGTGSAAISGVRGTGGGAAAAVSIEPITKLGQWRLIPAKKEGGKPFWYNKTTKAKQWEKPAEVALDEQARQAQAQQAAAEAVQPQLAPVASGGQGSEHAVDFPGADLQHAPTEPGLDFPPPYDPPRYLGEDPEEVAATAAAGVSSQPIRKAGDWRLIPAKKEGAKPFYYHKVTKTKQWEKPAEFEAEEERVLEEARATAAAEAREGVLQARREQDELDAAAANIVRARVAAGQSATGWRADRDPRSGFVFYRNVVSGARQWQKPEELNGPVAGLQSVEGASPAHTASETPSVQTTTTPSQTVVTTNPASEEAEKQPSFTDGTGAAAEQSPTRAGASDHAAPASGPEAEDQQDGPEEDEDQPEEDSSKVRLPHAALTGSRLADAMERSTEASAQEAKAQQEERKAAEAQRAVEEAAASARAAEANAAAGDHDAPLDEHEVDGEAAAAASGKGRGLIASEIGEKEATSGDEKENAGNHRGGVQFAGDAAAEGGAAEAEAKAGASPEQSAEDEAPVGGHGHSDSLMMGGPASGHGGPVDVAVVKRPALRPVASGLFAPEDDHLRLEGHLYKQSKSLLRLWLRRYWVTEGPLLLYWREEDDRQKAGAAGLPQAAIDLRFCTDLRLVSDDPLAFELEGTEVGTYRLRASTDQEARLWYSGLLCVLYEYGCLAQADSALGQRLAYRFGWQPGDVGAAIRAYEEQQLQEDARQEEQGGSGKGGGAQGGRAADSPLDAKASRDEGGVAEEKGPGSSLLRATKSFRQRGLADIVGQRASPGRTGQAGAGFGAVPAAGGAAEEEARAIREEQQRAMRRALEVLGGSDAAAESMAGGSDFGLSSVGQASAVPFDGPELPWPEELDEQGGIGSGFGSDGAAAATTEGSRSGRVDLAGGATGAGAQDGAADWTAREKGAGPQRRLRSPGAESRASSAPSPARGTQKGSDRALTGLAWLASQLRTIGKTQARDPPPSIDASKIQLPPASRPTKQKLSPGPVKPPALLRADGTDPALGTPRNTGASRATGLSDVPQTQSPGRRMFAANAGATGREGSYGEYRGRIEADAEGEGEGKSRDGRMIPGALGPAATAVLARMAAEPVDHSPRSTGGRPLGAQAGGRARTKELSPMGAFGDAGEGPLGSRGAAIAAGALYGSPAREPEDRATAGTTAPRTGGERSAGSPSAQQSTPVQAAAVAKASPSHATPSPTRRAIGPSGVPVSPAESSPIPRGLVELQCRRAIRVLRVQAPAHDDGEEDDEAGGFVPVEGSNTPETEPLDDLLQRIMPPSGAEIAHMRALTDSRSARARRDAAKLASAIHTSVCRRIQVSRSGGGRSPTAAEGEKTQAGTTGTTGGSIPDAFGRGGSAVIDVDSYLRRQAGAAGSPGRASTAGTGLFSATGASLGVTGGSTRGGGTAKRTEALPPALEVADRLQQAADQDEGGFGEGLDDTVGSVGAGVLGLGVSQRTGASSTAQQRSSAALEPLQKQAIGGAAVLCSRVRDTPGLAVRLLHSLGPTERPRAAVAVVAGLLDTSCSDDARLPSLFAAATDAGDLQDSFADRHGWEQSVLCSLAQAMCARPAVADFIARVAVPQVAAAAPRALRLWAEGSAGRSSGVGRVSGGGRGGSSLATQQESKEGEDGVTGEVLLDARRARTWGVGASFQGVSLPTADEEEGASGEERARNAAVRTLSICCFQHGGGGGSTVNVLGPGAEVPFELAQCMAAAEQRVGGRLAAAVLAAAVLQPAVATVGDHAPSHTLRSSLRDLLDACMDDLWTWQEARDDGSLGGALAVARSKHLPVVPLVLAAQDASDAARIRAARELLREAGEAGLAVPVDSSGEGKDGGGSGGEPVAGSHDSDVLEVRAAAAVEARRQLRRRKEARCVVSGDGLGLLAVAVQRCAGSMVGGALLSTDVRECAQAVREWMSGVGAGAAGGLGGSGLDAAASGYLSGGATGLGGLGMSMQSTGGAGRGGGSTPWSNRAIDAAGQEALDIATASDMQLRLTTYGVVPAQVSARDPPRLSECIGIDEGEPAAASGEQEESAASGGKGGGADAEASEGDQEADRQGVDRRLRRAASGLRELADASSAEGRRARAVLQRLRKAAAEAPRKARPPGGGPQLEDVRGFDAARDAVLFLSASLEQLDDTGSDLLSRERGREAVSSPRRAAAMSEDGGREACTSAELSCSDAADEVLRWCVGSSLATALRLREALREASLDASEGAELARAGAAAVLELARGGEAASAAWAFAGGGERAASVEEGLLHGAFRLGEPPSSSKATAGPGAAGAAVGGKGDGGQAEAPATPVMKKSNESGAAASGAVEGAGQDDDEDDDDDDDDLTLGMLMGSIFSPYKLQRQQVREEERAREEEADGGEGTPIH